MDEDISLPRATLMKMIKDNLAGEELRISSDAIDIVVDCCSEFVKMLYTQANEVCTEDKKNTIVPDHVLKAVEQLELPDWIEPLQKALVEYKELNKPVKSTKAAATMNDEQLADLQEQLFADARARTSSMHMMQSTELTQSGSVQAAPPAVQDSSAAVQAAPPAVQDCSAAGTQ